MYETEIETWRGPDRPPHEAWIDNDGDVGLMDWNSYSIIMSPAGARQLRDWLIQRFPVDSHPVNSKESTGSDRGQSDTPAPTGTNLCDTPTPIDGPHSSPPHPGTAVSPDAAVSCIDPAASQGSASGHEPGKVAGQVSTTRVRPVQGQDAAAVQQERSSTPANADSR